MNIASLYRLVSLSLTALAMSAALASTGGAAEKAKIVFSDGFERADKFLDLFPRDASRWTHREKTRAGNSLEVVDRNVHSGTRALRLTAERGSGPVSKASIEHEGMRLRAGQTVAVKMALYIENARTLHNLFIMDLECTICWDKGNRIQNQHPGVRVVLKGEHGVPVVERGKIGIKRDLIPANTKIRFPLRRWVEVTWKLRLANDESGISELYLDSKRVLAARGPNFPDQAIFAKYGVKLTQLLYDKIEVGITANSTAGPVAMIIDDVSVAILD